MKILIGPQVRFSNKIWYKIEENKVTATINGITDTFDFTDMPDGELQLWDREGNDLIETTLEEIPIVSARKENGELFVEILFSIDSKEMDQRLLFPEPMTLEGFNDLMAEIAERDKEVEPDGENDLEE